MAEACHPRRELSNPAGGGPPIGQMAKLIFAMNLSLEGHVDHQAFAPDQIWRGG